MTYFHFLTWCFIWIKPFHWLYKIYDNHCCLIKRCHVYMKYIKIDINKFNHVHKTSQFKICSELSLWDAHGMVIIKLFLGRWYNRIWQFHLYTTKYGDAGNNLMHTIFLCNTIKVIRYRFTRQYLWLKCIFSLHVSTV